MEYTETKFESLYLNTYKDAYFLARNRVGENNALDIVHDAYISIANNMESIESDDHFKRYLLRTIINKCHDFEKKKKPEMFADSRTEEFDLEDFVEDEINIDYKPEQNFDYQELKTALNNILCTLPADQQSCIQLYYYNQYSIKEIAEILNVSENTVKSRLNYGKKKIKTEIELLDKKGVKLFSAAPALLLPWFFKENFAGMAIPKGLATGAKGIAPSINKSITKVGKKVMLSTSKKIIIGLVAVGLAVSGAVFMNQQASSPETEMLNGEKSLEAKKTTVCKNIPTEEVPVTQTLTFVMDRETNEIIEYTLVNDAPEVENGHEGVLEKAEWLDSLDYVDSSFVIDENNHRVSFTMVMDLTQDMDYMADQDDINFVDWQNSFRIFYDENSGKFIFDEAVLLSYVAETLYAIADTFECR